MHEITVPKLNSNDSGYLLTAWHYSDGDVVPASAPVVEIETSKTAEELSSEVGGVLQRGLTEMQECRPGEVIGRLFPDEQQRQRFLIGRSEEPAADLAGVVITEPARSLIDRYRISQDAIRTLSTRVIRAVDVQRLIDEADVGGSRIQHLGKSQLAVAAVVAESHHTIPAAYAVVKVVVDAALAALRGYADRQKIAARLPELLIRRLAGLVETYPMFFASAREDGTAVLAGQVRVGVTIDIGRGLYLPVIGADAVTSLATVTAAMAGLRAKALREEFTAADLTGATIGLSLPAGDVLLAQPLIMPGTSCMLALGATHPEVIPDGHGQPVVRQVALLGLAYDHRLINGRAAARFLGGLKAALESADLSDEEAAS
ncbi:dihydrolipoamide acetyltransferase component of pyruvate dehydrogenase complex [Actinoplanes italicus]|uniref:2-oxoglutarate dehydrogenase E2 component (Dihydrolipoamide succinyltransferase) n=1 Tax=Actinoplanes italicus TaxID=113567 RepID=A0A2T0KFS2_9ACTN|nr:2-oxo acid dehydrogenase subunit E2 [Actinoplanes italicus]PRX22203.1 2-oxoglutarate dehydrogenase E2 component (dihydrolipoamide succinyltransferase) [Actinoplanes italicus]GIE29376.1 dihydrolipoamide acetyltransferase component of pyruvate dehydrogenase complex [Actinoplanes italicus]